MSPTVDALRNEIRVAVGRYERVESTAFTKEALAAIGEAVGADIDQNRFPSKSRMRADIRQAVDGAAYEEGDDGPFRKADLEAIVATLRTED